MGMTTTKVSALSRYAVKGLPGDLLSGVRITNPGETFPDDRRYALFFCDDNNKKENESEESKETKTENINTIVPSSKPQKMSFDEHHPEWIHKSKFLCAFTAPELMATIYSEYNIVSSCNNNNKVDEFSHAFPNDRCVSSTIVDGCGDKENNDGQMIDNKKEGRFLTVWKQNCDTQGSSQQQQKQQQQQQQQQRQSSPLLGPVDLSTVDGRSSLSQLLSNLSGRDVTCVTANIKAKESNIGDHMHQFGNTRSGVRLNKGDTRTIHIINAATVRVLSKRIGVTLDPMRFRPNIVLDDDGYGCLKPWEEFDLVDRCGSFRRVIDVENDNEADAGTRAGGISLDVIGRTVRCAGVSIDSNDPTGTPLLDIPVLLQKHFPEFGPFLGVYAVVRTGGKLNVGDSLRWIDDNKDYDDIN